MRTYLFPLLFVLLNTAAYSQETIENPSIQFSEVIPPSPTSAALGKYGEYSVNQSTGVPSISVPLLNVSSGKINLPINISYHASGNKVSDRGSWVGLGWSLIAGGVVTRTVRGLPDEYPVNGFFQRAAWIDQAGQNGVTETDYSTMLEASKGVFDTEPDQFNFIFNGYSGSFYFDKLGAIVVRPQLPIQISHEISSDKISKFTIKTPDGLIYTFDLAELTDYSHKSIDFNSTWHLTSIQSVDGIDNITFAYESHNIEYDLIRQKVANYEYDLNNHDAYYLINESTVGGEQVSIPQVYKLDYIQTNNAVIDFTWHARGTVGAQLDKIEYKRSFIGEVITDVTFSQDLFPGNNDCSGNLCDRLRLNSVSINEKLYQFEYDNTLVPPVDSYDQDHWGYYNAANNLNQLPEYEDQYHNVFNQNGANKLPDSTAMKMALLNKIIYPTGGYTTFDFEPNKFDNSDGINQIKFNAEWVFQVDMIQGQQIVQQDFTWPNYAFIDQYDQSVLFEDITWEPEVQIFVEFGTIDDGNGNPEEYLHGSPKVEVLGTNYSYTYGNSELAGFNENNIHQELIKEYFFVDWTKNNNPIRLQTGMFEGNYTKAILRAEGSYISDNYDLLSEQILIGGLRIKSIKQFDSDGKYLGGKKYEYVKEDGVKSSAKLIYGSGNLFASNHYLYVDHYHFEEGCWDELTVNYEKITIHSTPLASDLGNIIIYNRVEEFQIDELELGQNGSIVTTFDVETDNSSSLNYPYPVRVANNYRRGQPLSKEFYRFNIDSGESEIIKKEEFFYKNSHNPSITYGAKIVPERSYAVIPYTVVIAGNWGYSWSFNFCGGFFQDMRRFNSLFYMLSSGWKYLDSKKITNYYDDGETFVTETKYAYHPNFQQISSETIISPDRVIQKEYSYPYNLIGTASSGFYNGIQEMKDNYVISSPVEERIYLVDNADFDSGETNWGKRLISSQFTNYYNFRPSAVYKLNINEPITDYTNNLDVEIGIDSRYGDPSLEITYSNGKIVEQRGKDKVSTTYLWSYDEQYPVLKIENLDFNQVQILADGLEMNFVDNLKNLQDESLIQSKVQQLRAALESAHPSAFVSSYTYQQLVGIKSMTDPNGQTTEYFYDESNRLDYVLDHNGNIIQKYEYNLINQY